MGHMKKMYMEQLLEAGSHYEPDTRYAILENAVDLAIADLEKAQA